MTAPREDHEEQLIRAFILPQRQSRYLELLPNPRRRRDVLKELAHFKHLDLRWALAIPPNSTRPITIMKLLQSKGAPARCWVTSESSKLDTKEMDLLEALKEVVGYGMGTFPSCLPGQLAYFEDEEDRWILQRPTAS